MLKLSIMFFVLLNACSIAVVKCADDEDQSVSYDKEELAQLITSKIEKGASKSQVAHMLLVAKINKYSYVELRKTSADEPIPESSRIRAGKKISLSGSYKKEIEGNEWNHTRYGLIASTLAVKKNIFAVKRTIYVRFNFDEEERLVACFITEESDVL